MKIILIDTNHEKKSSYSISAYKPNSEETENNQNYPDSNPPEPTIHPGYINSDETNDEQNQITNQMREINSDSERNINQIRFKNFRTIKYKKRKEGVYIKKYKVKNEKPRNFKDIEIRIQKRSCQKGRVKKETKKKLSLKYSEEKKILTVEKGEEKPKNNFLKKKRNFEDSSNSTLNKKELEEAPNITPKPYLKLEKNVYFKNGNSSNEDVIGSQRRFNSGFLGDDDLLLQKIDSGGGQKVFTRIFPGIIDNQNNIMFFNNYSNEYYFDGLPLGEMIPESNLMIFNGNYIEDDDDVLKEVPHVDCNQWVDKRNRISNSISQN